MITHLRMLELLHDCGWPDLDVNKFVDVINKEIEKTDATDIGYQFQIDGRAFGAPIRRTWEEAVTDAVSAGYATRASVSEVRFNQRACVSRVPRQKKGLFG
jgi:hypothetical protein